MFVISHAVQSSTMLALISAVKSGRAKSHRIYQQNLNKISSTCFSENLRELNIESGNLEETPSVLTILVP